jgi:hypothetical protein
VFKRNEDERTRGREKRTTHGGPKRPKKKGDWGKRRCGKNGAIESMQLRTGDQIRKRHRQENKEKGREKKRKRQVGRWKGREGEKKEAEEDDNGKQKEGGDNEKSKDLSHIK